MRSRVTRNQVLWFGLFSLLLFAGACAKKVAVPSQLPAPSAPPAAQPTVTLNASTTFVKPGETIRLTWSSTNATDLNLAPGIGKVAPEGSTPVKPAESTTYTITATGPGGTADATVRVTVSAAAVAPSAPEPVLSIDELFRSHMFDAYFDTDKSDIRADAREALSKTAEFLRSYPQVKVILEGHCDERGSTEYNIGLGERRALASKNFLVSLGVGADRIETVSFGKERPFCTEHDESCWQQNRRGHFVKAQ